MHSIVRTELGKTFTFGWIMSRHFYYEKKLLLDLTHSQLRSKTFVSTVLIKLT